MIASGGELRDALIEALGDPLRVRDGESDRDLHAGDPSFHRPVRPDIVVYPVTTGEVVCVLELADRFNVPVVPFGAGTSLEGHVIPVSGGISLDLTRMNRVLQISPPRLTATVEAGVTRSQLEKAAGPHGLSFPVDPGADATLGGMAATNAAGTTTVRYGKMRANVLALTAVLPGGKIIRTGTSAAKTSAGFDITGLLVGSEGTLAVITELTLRLHPIPEEAVVLRLGFRDVDAACRTASLLVATGAGVTRLELVDERVIAAVNAYSATSFPELPTLFVESTGMPETVSNDLALVCDLATEQGAVQIEYERDPEARARIWQSRHDATYALAARAPGKKPRSTDVCVPVDQLADALRFARLMADRLGLDAGVMGHAGDGNVHVALFVDPANQGEVGRSDELVKLLVADAIARGGTSTGEHGIGLGKIGALEDEHPDLLPLMRGIKAVFDPNGIMNPGKVMACQSPEILH